MELKFRASLVTGRNNSDRVTGNLKNILSAFIPFQQKIAHKKVMSAQLAACLLSSANWFDLEG